MDKQRSRTLKWTNGGQVHSWTGQVELSNNWTSGTDAANGHSARHHFFSFRTSRNLSFSSFWQVLLSLSMYGVTDLLEDPRLVQVAAHFSVRLMQYESGTNTIWYTFVLLRRQFISRLRSLSPLLPFWQLDFPHLDSLYPLQDLAIFTFGAAQFHNLLTSPRSIRHLYPVFGPNLVQVTSGESSIIATNVT